MPSSVLASRLNPPVYLLQGQSLSQGDLATVLKLRRKACYAAVHALHLYGSASQRGVHSDNLAVRLVPPQRLDSDYPAWLSPLRIAPARSDSMPGRQMTLSVTAGRFFFICIGVNHASNAPLPMSKSCTCPRSSGVESSMLVSSSDTCAAASRSLRPRRPTARARWGSLP